MTGPRREGFAGALQTFRLRQVLQPRGHGGSELSAGAKGDMRLPLHAHNALTAAYELFPYFHEFKLIILNMYFHD